VEKLRSSLYNTILHPILIKKLTELNYYEYKGKTYKFSEENILNAVDDLNAPLTNGLIKTSEEIYDSLMLGHSYQEKLFDDTKRSFNLKYIDWDNPANNDFHILEEFSVEREDGQGNARPDIVLFVNGIPFGVIECKKSSISVEQGIEQTLRNQNQNYIPHLFKFAQIVMATNKNETKYATCGTAKKYWATWKESNETWLAQVLNKTVENRLATRQDKDIIALFHPERLLELTKYFILFDKNVKKIARYQQYFAIKEIIKTIEEKDAKGNRQSGVIWHTQGSGKSLTMVMLAKYVLSELSNSNPKIILVTDRIDLDKQIHRTFNHTRLKANRATSGQNLINLINDNSADIITTLVHKFDTASNKQKPIQSKDIFVLVDESHRTQYGQLHIKMKQVFPNACYLGFTGTPLMKNEKSTMIKFGKLIHKYTIADGVEDKTIVPLLYEGKMIEQTVNTKAIDTQLDIITRNLNDKQKEAVKQKWSRFEKIASSDQRIKLIAFDINEHFKNNYKTEGCQFKAMLATNKRIEAIRYLEAFEELGDLNIAVVISSPDQREGYETIDDAQDKNKIVSFWNKLISQYGNAEEYEDRIKDEFVNGDDIDLLIVVDKLLTGFDAPRATILYIDKPMQDHTLLQAIARVNRIYEGKEYGFIIDYRGLLDKLDAALKVYSGAGFESFDPEDLYEVVYDIISIIGTLRHYYTELQNIFIPVKNKNDVEEYEVLLENEELRENFYNALSGFSRHVAIALESEKIYNALGHDEISKFKKDMKFYQELRKTVMIRYSDTIDHKEYEAKMQRLMDNYISAEEIIRITNPINILDEKKFEEELNRLGSPRARADAIRTRLTKSINANWDENPAYYKKFSERIKETLDAYKNQRIAESDYLNQMSEILRDFRKGYSGEGCPENIKNNVHAQAFYGVIREIILKDKNTSELVKILSDLAIDIDMIIEKHSKVDWHENIEVHKKIEQEIEDSLYLYEKKYGLKLNFDEIDKIILNVKTVALRRY
jgi:type I restriction enzyme R subunit